MSQLYNSGTGAAALLCAQGTEEPAPAELNWLSVHSNEHYVKYSASLCIKSLLITNPLEVTITLCILYFTLMYCKGV